MANKDGLEPRQSIDFETLQRVKRQQREAAKNAKSEPKSKDLKALGLATFSAARKKAHGV